MPQKNEFLLCSTFHLTSFILKILPNCSFSRRLKTLKMSLNKCFFVPLHSLPSTSTDPISQHPLHNKKKLNSPKKWLLQSHLHQSRVDSYHWPSSEDDCVVGLVRPHRQIGVLVPVQIDAPGQGPSKRSDWNARQRLRQKNLKRKLFSELKSTKTLLAQTKSHFLYK